MRSPAAPGALFSLTAFILLLLCSLSTPVIKSIFFLKAEVATEIVTVNVQGTARFGVFGWCTGDINATSSVFSLSSSVVASQCSEEQVGYTFNPTVLGVEVSIGSNYDRIFIALTKALVMVPISCGLAFMVFVTSLFSLMCASRFWEVMAFFWSIFAMLVTCISWIFEIVAFTIVKNRLSSETDGQLTGTLGNALWMHLAAAVVLLFTTCFTCFGMCGTYRQQRRDRAAGVYAAPLPSPYQKQGWRQRFQRQPRGTATY